MNGIKMSDCKFYVDKEARTVICVIPPYIKCKDGTEFKLRDMLINFLRENCSYSDISLYDAIMFWDKKFISSISMPRSFIGKAICSVDDEWNEETGKMIAFSRAKDKCYKSFFKRANMFVQAVDKRLSDAMDVFNNFGLKLEEKREAMQINIEERTKGKEE